MINEMINWFKYTLKYKIRSFKWLKVLNSPYKPLKLYIYFGKIARGVPYFYPRKTVKSKTKPGYLEFKQLKWFGFNYCSLGYKTKWSDTDYRFEWCPQFSFVFLKKQFHITVSSKADCNIDHYWESWLYYNSHTKGSKKDRIKQTIKEFPLIYTRHKSGEPEMKVNYYNNILKKKYLKYIDVKKEENKEES